MRFFLLLICISYSNINFAQGIKVSTIAKNINASGGVSVDKDGNVYVSDFGEALGKVSLNTNVYRLTKSTWDISSFASGFRGASGACFDSKGNFYQSNPFGNRVSKVTPDGKVTADWSTNDFKTPIGIVANEKDELYVCNCGGNAIRKINKNGQSSEFATSSEFNCPNGLAIDDSGNLYACNFNDGKILKIDPKGNVTVFAELPALQGGAKPVGNGHVTWKNGYLYAVTIGRGELYRISRAGQSEIIAGIPMAFSNIDGGSKTATFCKPNGIAASITGDTLYINVSENGWTAANPLSLHPAHVRMVTGLNSLGGIKPMKTDIELIKEISKQFSQSYINADYDKLANTYTLDAKIFPDKTAIIAGREAIKKRWILPEGVSVIRHVATPDEIKILGDHAYDYGYYEVETKRADGSSVTGKGKYVILWRKENNTWKIHLDIWNSVQK